MEILIISHDVVGKRMAGPGIRYFHLARVLSREFDTVLAVPSEVSPELSSMDFCTVQYTQHDWDSIASRVEAADTVIFPSDIANDFSLLARSEAFLVVDGYDPLLAEWLTLSQEEPIEDWETYWWDRMCLLNEQYLIGDFFICASERQRDWWLGLLETNGRVNPYTFREDPSLRSLIDVVPYGVTEIEAHAAKPVIRGVWPGIGERDTLILWGGGLWPWLDPLTAIRAVGLVCQHHPEVRLIFPGTKHPNPLMEASPTQTRSAYQLAESLELLNKVVFFGDWIPYAEWPDVLLESDIALSLHYDTIESRLAFRSRIMEYIAAELPIISTRGDATSDLVDQLDLGVVVDDQDVEGVAEAISALLEGRCGKQRENFIGAQRLLAWDRVVEPLIRFCRAPRKAPDKIPGLPGNPYYERYYQRKIDEKQIVIDQQKLEIQRLKGLISDYEKGKFIRFTKWLDERKKELGF